MTKPYVILEAPSPLGLHPKGVQDAPAALLQAGLAERLGAAVAGRVEPLPYDPERDRESGVLNPDGIARYAIDLADRIVPIVEADAIPVVLGGDCSILLGCALAMRRIGRSGLLFVDGHADFYQAEAEPKGEVASMELGFLTGRGAPVLADIEGRSPLVPDEDVVVFGRRDGEDAARFRSRRVEETSILMIDLDEIRRTGLDGALERAFDHLSRPALDGFWLHVDVDVLDEEIMPAVDSPQPGGLSFAELTAVLGGAVATGRLRGLNVTIFNPRMDPDGSITADLTNALVEGLCERLVAAQSLDSDGC